MIKVVRVLRTAIVACGAALGAFLGRADGLLISLVILAIVDYITGVVAAAIGHRLDSRTGFIGIAKG